VDIVFIGTTRFGLRCLERLSELPDCRIVGAVAAPPAFSISYRPEGVRNVLHADVPGFCAAHGLPCLLLSNGMNAEGLLEQVAAWQPDAFVVAGWYHMVPRSWRRLAPAYGLHASLLPDYSGGAPLVWAMINGEERTGITMFQLGDGVDDGPIVGQLETLISAEDTIATLYERVEELGIQLLERHIPRLADGGVRLEPQDERRRRTFPQRGPEDGLIDWSQPAKRIHDFVRAQTRPYPGAFGRLEGARITVWTSHPENPAQVSQALGQFAADGDKVIVGTGDGGSIELVSFAIDGEDADAAGFCDRFGVSGQFDSAP
jgi:methionyl-tRNA formyltransferase